MLASFGGKETEGRSGHCTIARARHSLIAELEPQVESKSKRGVSYVREYGQSTSVECARPQPCASRRDARP